MRFGLAMLAATVAELRRDAASGLRECDEPPAPMIMLGAEGIVRGAALLVGRDGPIVPPGPSVGVSWSEEPYNPFRLSTGRSPATRGLLHVDLPVNIDPNEGWKQWRLVDDIVLRNTLRE